MRPALLVTACLVLACASYQKPGATQEDWANDHQFCELYAQRMNENTSFSRSLTQASLVRQCLRERGWSRE